MYQNNSFYWKKTLSIKKIQIENCNESLQKTKQTTKFLMLFWIVSRFTSSEMFIFKFDMDSFLFYKILTSFGFPFTLFVRRILRQY